MFVYYSGIAVCVPMYYNKVSSREQHTASEGSKTNTGPNIRGGAAQSTGDSIPPPTCYHRKGDSDNGKQIERNHGTGGTEERP